MGDEKTDQQLTDETIKEYEFDAEIDKDKINNIVQLKKDRFTATKQKNKTKKEIDDHYKGREFYKDVLKKRGLDTHTGEPVKKDDKKGEPKKKESDEDLDARIKRITGKQLGNNKMKSMGLDDDLIKEIEDYAKALKIDIDAALKKSVIKTMIDKFKDKQDTKKSSITNKHRGSDGKNTTVYDFEKIKDMTDVEVKEYINKIDITTEEGKKEWESFEKWYSKQKDR